MKSLVIGDIHVKLSNLDVNAKLFDFIEQLINDKSNEIGNIIFLGDVYETKAIIRSEAQNFLIKRLQRLGEYLPVHILVGNHDYENLNCLDSALRPLELIPNVTVYHEPKYVKELNSIMIPYIHSSDDFAAFWYGRYLESKTGDGTNLAPFVFCHQGFLGFDMGSGFIDNAGVNPSNMHGCNFIVGHYHTPQEKDNVIYLGTPFSHSFGESNQTKRIAIVNHKTSHISYINMTDKLPQHYKLKYREDKEYLYPIKDGDFVEVEVECSENDLPKFSKSIIEKNFEPLQLHLKVKYSILDAKKTIRINENLSHTQMLKQYLEMKGRPDLLDKSIELLKNAIL